MSYSYESALEAAGAKILAFKESGDYQGTWYAYVEYNGNRGWVEGSYGSCSGCDAFQAEFDYYDTKKEDYQQRLADFGKSYLDCIYTTEQEVKLLEERAATVWGSEYKDILEWVKSIQE